MDDAAKFRVSKLSAAQRQLDCALELWFHEGDPVAIHTLAAAAHQIIHDIHAKKAPEKELLFDSAIIKDEYRQEFINIVKDPGNFFKHADRDRDEILEFAPFLSVIFMMFSITGLSNLGERRTDIESTFLSWLGVNRPKLVTAQFQERLADTVPGEQLDAFRKMKKSEFLSLMLQGLAMARDKH